ncbi:MAG: EF-P beta-lysylation protein EpmB [Pirellulales bacterium]|nr:EF-P beta-lysylation protein EpmB [Pirellulales bacterium]
MPMPAVSASATPADRFSDGETASCAARWQEEMKRAIRDAAELCRVLSLPRELADEARRAAGDFPLFAPRPYVARMRRGDVHDPLLRQVLPIDAENTLAPGFVADPVADHAAEITPGLLHKYHGRVLLVTTGACAVHCRYCFRRHYPYAEVPKSVDAWEPAIDAIAGDASINEVILSGGDPLTLADETLGELVERLEQIEHLRVLRIHTRLPIMIPQRVDDALCDLLAGTRLVPYVVVHANHAAEIDEHVAAAIQRLQAAGAAVLNQSVLLAGVNDSVEALEELSRRLIELRVQPYYLHQLDRVDGAAHFEVPVERGKEILKALRERLPGYAVPRYVQEVPGAEGKTEIR